MQQVVDRFARHRKELVAVLKGKGINDPKVLDAVMNIPRHEFIDVPDRLWSDHLAALYGRVPKPAAGAETGREGAGDRHGQRLPDSGALPHGGEGVQY
jgi:hypothetical protein